MIDVSLKTTIMKSGETYSDTLFIRWKRRPTAFTCKDAVGVTMKDNTFIQVGLASFFLCKMIPSYARWIAKRRKATTNE